MGEARAKSALPIVTKRQVAAQGSPDCTLCGGLGYFEIGHKPGEICPEAGANFARRYGHQTTEWKGQRRWLPGCPRS